MARRGPPLVTVMVEVTCEPCATGFGDFDLARRRSAPSGRMSKVTPLLLLPVFGSLSVVVIVAVLVSVRPVGPMTALVGAVAMRVMLLVAPTA